MIFGGPTIRFRTPARRRLLKKICLGIEKVADDLLKAAEIIDQLGSKFALAAEKAGERSVFDRTRGIRVSAHLGERDDVFVAENLEMSGGKRIAQQLDRGQREDEVANCAAADHQDAAHDGLSTDTPAFYPPSERGRTPR